ncbi:glycosyltransferase [Roseibium sp.]|uniref:glycosyltransferase n=1 Tax=Roseibium sp. TaxID=1936156 RepID=UPI003A968D5A
MRIIHVLTRLLRAGSEENTIATCLWQADHGHDVILLHGPDPDPHWLDHHGDRIHFMEIPELVHPINPLRDYRAVKTLQRLFSEIRPDVIHTHQSKAGIIGRLASATVPCALVVHGIHIIPFDGVGRLKRAFYISAEKFAARYTDLFIAVSRSVGQTYTDVGICRHVEPVYSGMPLERFRSAVLPADWRHLLGVEPASPSRPQVVLMLAAYEPRKRHIEFLRAFSEILPDIPDVRILFAGKGPVENKVRAAVEELGLAPNVTFCGFRSDPEALISLADICILTSEREGLPRVVVQYLASGKPVIVADLPGIEEIVQNGVNGLISDPDDMSDTAKKIRDLLKDRSALASLADGAKRSDVSEWDLQRLGARTTELYLAAMAHLPESRRRAPEVLQSKSSSS